MRPAYPIHPPSEARKNDVSACVARTRFFRSGTVCLDVINQTWSPMFDLVNVFDVFLPQLLLYPNPTDPLNGEAASLMMRNPSQYAQRIRDCVAKYAQNVALHDESEDAGEDEDGDEDEDEE